MLALLLQQELEEYYQAKNLTREIDLTRGQILTETAKMLVVVKRDKAPRYFDYPVPFEFYDHVSSYKITVNETSYPGTIYVSPNGLLPVFFLRFAFDKDFREGEKLQITVTYNAIVEKFVNKYTSLFTNESQAMTRESERSNRDRTLQQRLTSVAAMPIHVTEQTLKIKVPFGKLVTYDTQTTPNENTQSSVTIGPIQYAVPLQEEYVKITYYAAEPTLEVTSKREVMPSGMQIRVGDDESQLGLAHIVDTLHFKNLDKAPKGLRRGRMDISMLKQGLNRVVNNITIVIPKAKNIKVYDRTGKVASKQILQETDVTKVVVKPRIELFGQDEADIILEYDTTIVQQAYSDYGVIVQAAPKLSLPAFYKSFEICIYPPMGATGVEFYSQAPLEFNRNATAAANFDFQDRQGACVSHGFSDYNVAGNEIGVKWQLDQEVVFNRLKTVALFIFCVIVALWTARVVFGF